MFIAFFFGWLVSSPTQRADVEKGKEEKTAQVITPKKRRNEEKEGKGRNFLKASLPKKDVHTHANLSKEKEQKRGHSMVTLLVSSLREVIEPRNGKREKN